MARSSLLPLGICVLVLLTTTALGSESEEEMSLPQTQLQITQFEVWPQVITDGETALVYMKVKNVGTNTALNVKAQLILSGGIELKKKEPRLDNEKRKIIELKPPRINIPPGEEFLFKWEVVSRGPEFIKLGPHTIQGLVKADNAVAKLSPLKLIGVRDAPEWTLEPRFIEIETLNNFPLVFSVRIHNPTSSPVSLQAVTQTPPDVGTYTPMDPTCVTVNPTGQVVPPKSDVEFEITINLPPTTLNEEKFLGAVRFLDQNSLGWSTVILVSERRSPSVKEQRIQVRGTLNALVLEVRYPNPPYPWWVKRAPPREVKIEVIGPSGPVSPDSVIERELENLEGIDLRENNWRKEVILRFDNPQQGLWRVIIKTFGVYKLEFGVTKEA